MSTPWPEGPDGPEGPLPRDEEMRRMIESALEEIHRDSPCVGESLVSELVDPYARVHDALVRSFDRGDLPEEWHLTDFLVIGVAESHRSDLRGQSVLVFIGPSEDIAPHRVLGLLDYARQRYSHSSSCCRCSEDDEDQE